MAKTTCKILGIVTILAGIIGFFTHGLMGMHMTWAQNIFYLLTGAIAVWYGFTGTSEAAHMYSRIIGTIYLLLGVFGFITPEIIEKILRIDTSAVSANLMTDNIVHLIIGAIFLIAGVLSETHTAAPTAAKSS